MIVETASNSLPIETVEPNLSVTDRSDHVGEICAELNLESSGWEWKPEVVRKQSYNGDIEIELRRETPSNDQLLKSTAQSRNLPPQSWYDDETSPFEDDDN